MTAKKLKQIIHASPFQPFRLRLADGEQIVVTKPRALVGGDDVAVVGICTRPGKGGVEKFRLIDVSQVVAANHISNGRRRPTPSSKSR